MVTKHIVRAGTPSEDSMQIIFNPTITLSLLLAVVSVPGAAQSVSAKAGSQTTPAHGTSKSSGSQYGSLKSKANKQNLDLNGIGGDILGAPPDYIDADTSYLGAPSVPFIPPEDRVTDDSPLPMGQGLSLSSQRSGGDSSSDTLGTDLSQSPKSKQKRVGHAGTVQTTRKSPTGTLDAGGDAHPIYRTPW
ncbi:hypothetical protein P3T25_001348 [Paraburkholderia sp. GAS32]